MNKKIICLAIVLVFITNLFAMSVVGLNIQQKENKSIDSQKNGVPPPVMYPIEGPTSIQVLKNGKWTFSASSNNFHVKFVIQWGDGTGDVTRWVTSGGGSYFWHTYLEKGTHKIEAYALDKDGQESNHVYYTVGVTKSKSLNYPIVSSILIKLIEQSQLLQRILQL